MIGQKGDDSMGLLKPIGLILILATVAFVLLGIFLKLAAFLFVSVLTLIVAVILFTMISKNRHKKT